MAFRRKSSSCLSLLLIVCLFVIQTNGQNTTQTMPSQNGTHAASTLNATQMTSQSQNVNSTTTAPNAKSGVPKTQGGTTKGSPGSEPDSSALPFGPRIIKLLNQVGAAIPGFQNSMNSGFGLSTSQLQAVNGFVKLLMNVTDTNPQDVSDILQSLQSSGLFDSVRNIIGGGSPNALPKDAAEACDRINKSLTSTSSLNTTVAEAWKLDLPLSDDLAWANVSLKDALDWCQNNFTDSSSSDEGVPSYPGIEIPTSHSVYDWKKCQADIGQMLQGLPRRDSWVLEMLDASGKPGSSILKGNLRFMGNYKECQAVSHRDANSFSKIEGNICRAHVKLPIALPSTFLSGPEPRIQWDLCLPKSCLDSDLNFEIIQRKLYNNIWMSCTKDLDMSDDAAAIVAVVILSIFGLLLVAGTIMEFCVSNAKPTGPNDTRNGHVNNVYMTHVNHGFDNNELKQNVTSFTEPNGKPAMIEIGANGDKVYPELNGNASHVAQGNGSAQNGDVSREVKENSHKPEAVTLPRWQRALLAFSVPRNTGKILSVKSAPGTIGCLHGIRVLSMAWVILGHTFISFSIYENPLDVFSLFNTFAFQMILNAPLSVDTFFVMSGLLTCYLFMKTLGKKGKVTPKEMAMYYVHRYWRLTPSLIIWIMIVACLVQYMGEGRPAWTDYVSAEACRNNWWINILYINNVYKQDEPCVGVTWFLAHDMQFYIVAPLVMIPFVYGQRLWGFLKAIMLIGIHVASTIWLELKYNADMIRNQPDYSTEIYFKPYTRVAPFAIGLMLGWVLWKTKCQVKMNKCVVFLGWIVCAGLILTLTFVSYDENKDIPASDWTKTGRVVFQSFYRPTWAIAISWLIFACATGYGGYINSILSWEGWLPFSRLTYSAFLIHLTILGFESAMPEFTMLFTLTSLSYYFLATFVLAYGIGYLLTITVESPFLALEKVVLG